MVTVAYKTSNGVLLRSAGDDTTNSPIEHTTPEGTSIVLQTAALIVGCVVATSSSSQDVLHVRHGNVVDETILANGLYVEIETPTGQGKLGLKNLTNEAAYIHTLCALSRDMIGQNVPIDVVDVPSSTALERFQAMNMGLSASYVRTSNKVTTKCFRLGEYMIPHVSLIGTTPTTNLCGIAATSLELIPCHHGFLIRFDFMKAYEPSKTLFTAYERGKQWGNVRHNTAAGLTNEFITHTGSGPANFVAAEESRFDYEILRCSRHVAAKPEVRVVLIAGPSASGKTTFAAKLSQGLSAQGRQPVTLSTDDYYRDCTEPTYPKLPNGKPNHETIDALRIDTLNDHLQRLFNGEEVEIPVFDMVNSRPKEKGHRIRLPANGVLVMEGIFALNPGLTAHIDNRKKYKIFIVPIPQVSLSELHFLSNQTSRLLRRISRDFLHRGRGGAASIARVPSVRVGEEINIYPFLNEADYLFNSSMGHEVNVLKCYCVPLLSVISPVDPTYGEAQRLLNVLEGFFTVSDVSVARDSLLREFIGGSVFEEERPIVQTNLLKDLECVSSPLHMFARKPDDVTLFDSCAQGGRDTAVAAMVDSIMFPLDTPWAVFGETATSCAPIPRTCRRGMAVCRATLTLLMHAAMKRSVAPELTVVVTNRFGAQDSAKCSAYYVEVVDKEGTVLPVSDALVANLSSAMRSLIQKEVPITTSKMATQTAITYFESVHMRMSALLLQNRCHQSEVDIVTCDGVHALLMCVHAPNSKAVAHTEFALHAYGTHGMVLCFAPALQAPPPTRPYTDLVALRRSMAHSIRCTCVGELNRVVCEGRVSEFVRVADTVQMLQVMSVADQMISGGGERVVCLAGPSSSGSTTWARAFQQYLESCGRPTTLLRFGQYVPSGTDEATLSLSDIDVAKLHADALALLNKGTNECVIVEGPFGLVPSIFPATIVKALRVLIVSQPLVNLDELTFIPGSKLRAARRIIRDFRTKGYPAQYTLASLTEEDGDAEELFQQHIAPYVETADAVINSSAPYELSALKGYVGPLLQRVPKDAGPSYALAYRLLQTFRWYDDFPGIETALGKAVKSALEQGEELH
eukprot:PhF_6_TR31795/c0_g1_i1/m.46862/K00876/udk, UCK; uridine kinase